VSNFLVIAVFISCALPWSGSWEAANFHSNGNNNDNDNINDDGGDYYSRVGAAATAA